MQRAGLLPQESRQVSRDGGVGGVGETDLGEPGAAAALGEIGWAASRKETIQQDGLQHVARELGLDRAPDDLRAAAQHVHDRRVLLGFRKERFLGTPARVEQADALRGVEPLHAFGQRAGNRVGQGQVHVVAAQKDVLAHGQPREHQVAAFVFHGDQGEVGRSAADVADQDDVAGLHLLAPLLALVSEPGVERSLRLFEQRDILETGLGGRLDGQLARDRGRTRRGRSGRPPGSRAARRPPCRRMRAFQASRRCSRKADDASTGEILATSSGALQGRMGERLIDALMREPALGRADQPARAPWRRGLARMIRPHGPTAISRAARAPRRETPWGQEGTETKGAGPVPTRRSTRRPAGWAIARPGRARRRRLWSSRRTPARSSSFPGRFQSRSETSGNLHLRGAKHRTIVAGDRQEREVNRAAPASHDA